MLPIKPEAKSLVRLIVTHSRFGDIDPKAIANQMPQYSPAYVAFVIEQLAQSPYPDLMQLIKDNF
ncbi:hypothetical protein [Vibrio mediterranei]|uniref:hypothetical protein n=1 Tax=Vibrio mediterranei TaxID=689 RepID=UPI002284940A|nr:hypothetical protein [Vibrio mediterranei]MCY9855421.1 hypothetical protein [Vibrio mediterranei]